MKDFNILMPDEAISVYSGCTVVLNIERYEGHTQKWNNFTIWSGTIWENLFLS